MKVSQSFGLCFFASLLLCVSAHADPRQWGAEGIPIRQGQYVRWTQTMARDASGNTLVVWSGKLSGNRDVRAQLFNPAGVAQWTTGGIDVAPEDHVQYFPVAVAVSGGWIVAWTDFRLCPNDLGCSDVYAQKLDMNGNRLWPDNDYTGVAVDVAERWIVEGSMKVVPDGAGGAIIAWLDTRNGYNIYAQRVAANGIVAWNQAVTVTDADYLHGFDAAAGTDGSALFAWWATGNNSDVFLSRILPDGTLPWGQAGRPVSVVTNDQYRASITPDGANGCYVAWKDGRGADNDIYAQRLGSDGQPLWTVNGIPLCTAVHVQEDVKLAPSFSGGGQDGVVAVWEDCRAADLLSVIYGQKVLADGSVVWATDGVRVSDDPPGYAYLTYPVAITDYNGGLVCTWERWDSGTWFTGAQVLAARVNQQGSLVWSPDPVPVGRLAVRQQSPMVNGGFGSYSVAWFETDSSGMQDVRYQLLDHATGERLLGNTGTSAVSGFAGYLEGAQCAKMSGHRTVMVWEDSRLGSFGTMLYYQIVGPMGDIERAVNGEPLAPNNTSHDQFAQRRATLCEDGNGGVVVAFEDNRWGTFLIRLSHINSQGAVVSPDSGIIVWNPPGIRDQMAARVSPDDQGGYYVAWSGYDANYYVDVYVMRLDVSLEPLWTEPVRLNESFPDDMLSALVPGDACCMAVWQSGDMFNFNVSGAKICDDGSVAWSDTLCNAPGDQGGLREIVAIGDGSGGMYLAWEDNRTPANHADIYAQRIAGDGTPHWTLNGVAVCVAENWQHRPHIAVDIRGDLNVIWEDFRDNTYMYVYAQKVSPNGDMRWAPNGVLVNSAAPSADLSLIASEGRDGILPVWIDTRTYDYDAYATHLDSTGAVYGDPFWRPDSGGILAGPVPAAGHYYVAAASDGWGGCVTLLTRLSREYEGEGDFTLDLYAQRIFDYTSGTETPNELKPHEYALYQNYPNPFNPVTEIRFDLPQAAHVKLAVYDLLGREASVLTNGQMSAGEHRLSFDAAGLPSGIYVYRIEAGSFRQAKKLVLLR